MSSEVFVCPLKFLKLHIVLKKPVIPSGAWIVALGVYTISAVTTGVGNSVHGIDTLFSSVFHSTCIK